MEHSLDRLARPSSLRAALGCFGLVAALLAGCASHASGRSPAQSSAAQAAASVERGEPQIELAIVSPLDTESSGSRTFQHGVTTYKAAELRRFRWATAMPSVADDGHPAVACIVDPRDATELEHWTSEHVRRLLAVVLDGKIVMVALIQSGLGRGIHFAPRDPWSEAQARELAQRIHAAGTAAPHGGTTPFALAAPYEPESGSMAEVALERTPCFGRCPSYVVRVQSDGSVRYEGRSDVRAIGEATRTVPADRVRELLAQFAAVDFLALNDEYKMPVTDLPSTILTLRVNGREKRVVNCWTKGTDAGADLAVHEMLDVLASAVDITSGSARWVK